MDVFIMRHGEASFNADSDINRELTLRGREEVLRSVKALANQSCPINAIYSSPYLRAKQTAEIAKTELGLSINIQPRLTPDYNPSKVTDWLYTLSESHHSVLITAHMPLVGKLISLMVDGDLLHSINFSTAMVVHLHAENPFDGCFTLKAVLPSA
ncbi:phosphohistidine phosphatase SixA [Alkalimarinus alittae]|uniref:Phosphohistidine phosphatase SixA n=1 Tax=Alkalimarinus alittae TaxID=2961619 RepID=A0ABY6MXA1_9ALTE|nr:phosphohistidine phosphatase SixA [Alkalimarinus alittae]UZE94456.1 phosphohistidine phosphatase SixA [Alkalimarinus alittae]